MKMTLLLAVLIIFLPAAPLYSEPGEAVALVLSGGGAKGAYEVGVWKALIDLEVEIDAVYGVSVGAVNGAAIAAGDYQKIQNLWLGITKSDVMNISEAGQRVLEGSFSMRDLADAAGEIIEHKGIDVSPLRALLETSINEDEIRAGGRDFGLLTFSLTEFENKYVYISDIPEGELIDYILASANFPLFQRQIINGKEYIDGAVYKNVPIEMVDPGRNRRAVVVVLEYSSPRDIADLISNYNAYELELTIIRPSGDLGSILDFNAEYSRRIMGMGYLDCLRTFKAIGGKNYFLSLEEPPIKKMFTALNSEEKIVACELLEVAPIPENVEEIFEAVIVPELAKEVDLVYGTTSGEREFAQTDLIEILAEKAGVERNVLYTPAGLLDAMVESYIARDDHKVYYDRYLDFISYLRLKTELRFELQTEPQCKYSEGFNSFNP
ncbi:MAG: patatin-like phospholipase family protein [Spirochaetales bacterium]|nr:patatin-like phospholipase family protein [Spirochaetales bacterium]